MNIFAQSLGLVSESDYVSLSDGLILQTNTLRDTANGAVHKLLGPAHKLLKPLQSVTVVSDWLEHAGAIDVSREQCVEMLHFLNSIGALRINRSWHQSLRCTVARLRMRLQGVKPVVLALRFPGSGVGLVLATSRAILPVLLLIALILPLGYGANLSFASFGFAQLAFCACLFITTAAHEGVHYWIAKSQGAQSQLVLRGLRIGVLHEPLSPRYELMSAIAGPAMGIGLGLAHAGVSLSTGQPAFVTLSVGVVGLFHVLSWLPGYGDGKAVKNYLRKQYAQTT